MLYTYEPQSLKIPDKETFVPSQCLSPAIPLCTVHLFEIPQELTGNDVITSWEARCDTMNTGRRLRALGRAFLSAQKVQRQQVERPVEPSLLPLLVAL